MSSLLGFLQVIVGAKLSMGAIRHIDPVPKAQFLRSARNQ